MAMRLLDLFSGIGGFSYAAEKLIGGYETVAFCEMDEFCQKVLKKHWPLGQEIAKDQAVGQLNSEWVTWLMGYPEGYLDISTESQTISQELQKEKKTEPKS